MDFAEYFGDNLRDAPEPEQFETFEQWTWRWIHEERIALEAVRESLLERSAPAELEIPAMPAGLPDNPSMRAAWAAYHSAPRPLRESRHMTPVRPPRFPKPRVGSEDRSALPEWMR